MALFQGQMGLLHVSGSLELEMGVKSLQKSVVESQVVVGLVLKVLDRLLPVIKVEV